MCLFCRECVNDKLLRNAGGESDDRNLVFADHSNLGPAENQHRLFARKIQVESTPAIWSFTTFSDSSHLHTLMGQVRLTYSPKSL